MCLIKNQTPYIGKIFLTFEKYPEYSGRTVLNKVHVNLGFTKLVSRMKPNMTPNGRGWDVDPKKIFAINSRTGLTVRDYRVDDKLSESEGTIYNACLNQDGILVGDIEDGWDYFKNGLVSVPGTNPRVAWCEDTFSWIGFSHRAAQSFTIGDKLFEPDWTPTDDELNEYQKYYVKYLNEFEEEYSEWENSDSPHKVPESEMTLNAWAAQFIPFTLHGRVTIETKEQALEAATNFATYVS